MELTGEKKSLSQLDEKLRACRDLCDLRDGVQARIDRAVEEQASVGEHIFRKVISEYRQQLDRIEQQITPLEAELDEARRVSELELEQARPVLAQIEDELAEVDFRGRVGEYDSTEVSDTKNRILPRLEEQKERVSQLMRQIEVLNSRGATAKRGHSPANERGTLNPSPVEAPAAKAPAAKAPTAKAPSPSPSDPAKDGWIQDEWYAEGAAKKAAPQPEQSYDPNLEDDPLAALADPTPEAGGSGGHAAGFLNLMINTGSHAGKKIPLLPMTMSIGREHDNNIELKDPDVARYHARITYASGNFTLENLDSSTGTTVNGVDIGEVLLKSGDMIRLGSTEIIVE